MGHNMRLKIFTLLSFFLLVLTEAGQRGKAWNAWLKFTGAVKSAKVEEVKKYISGNWAEELKLNDSHIRLLAWELRKNPVSFVNEFKIEEKIYLVLKSRVCPITLTFVEKEGLLTINDWVAAELKEGQIAKKGRPSKKRKLNS